MVAMVHKWCTINSGTDHLPGLHLMHQALKEAFLPLADSTESLSFPPFEALDLSGNTVLQTGGEALFIRKRPELTRRILLCGHMDTVYPAAHPFQTLTLLDNNRLNGPGVADMKGGLVILLHALKAFETSPDAEKIGWDVFINADEEIGSPLSCTWLNTLKQHYEAALVYEPALDASGTLAKNRKGSGKLTVVATGIAAHAGRAFEEGRNAICLLAEVITAMHALNGQREGVTLNVGLIAGGEALNVIPAKAVAKLDLRITQPNDEQWIRQKLDAILERFHRTGYELTLHGDFSRPVKRVTPRLQQLFHRAQRVGEILGLTLDWKDSGGCCDGNNLARAGLPVLDTLGVRGGAIHTTEEYLCIDSLVERAALSTMLLVDIAQTPEGLLP